MNPKNLLNLKAALTVALAVGASLAGQASAALIVTNVTNVAPAGTAGASYDPSLTGGSQFIASSTDLLQPSGGPAITPTIVYLDGGVLSATPATTTYESAAGFTTWTNGSVNTVYGNGAGNNVTNHAAYGTVNATVNLITPANDRDVSVTYNLGSLFNLTKIDVFTGWNDSGRDDSSFNVLVSSDGVTFAPLGTYAKPADNTGAFTTPVTNLHSFADDTGTLAGNVQYVRFLFTDADNGTAGVAEIDVFGTAVPEAGSTLMGLLGGLLLLKRRR